MNIVTNILALIAAIVLSAAAGGWYGWSERDEKAQIQVAEQARRTLVATERMHEFSAELDAARQQEQENVRLANQAFAADLRSGAQRVRVLAATCVPGAPGATGEAAKARAELDAETAINLDAIAGDGDAAVRDFNEMIDRYNKARDEARRINNGR